MSGAAPRVVVTASRQQNLDEYADALREAGLEPVRAVAGDPARVLLEAAAGVCLTGGVDVDPAAYGAAGSAFVGDVDPPRDVFEKDVLLAARELGLPTLAICRGMQMANVAFGGTLIDDIPHALRERATVRHQVRLDDGRTERGLIAEHVVEIAAGSALAGIAGAAELVTGARHHQAVDRVADELRVVARTRDGIAEALEARFPSPFWLAVQWHPESTRALDGGASRAIFAAFAAAARASR
ncbi:MAG TPA: gamma-glutamyl-gamma-aminobutyrate hydrolase family protein [Candidatus Elarobacter sp.]|nr:gamma-glutamyl-gamma-aminobutyrate hydrolase family protein [Candidatus Elarobacter sp.]